MTVSPHQVQKLYAKLIKEYDKYIELDEDYNGKFPFDGGTYFQGYQQAILDIQKLIIK